MIPKPSRLRLLLLPLLLAPLACVEPKTPPDKSEKMAVSEIASWQSSARASLELSMRSLAGDVRGNYFLPNQSLADAVAQSMGIPNPDAPLSDDLRVVSGCRPHSCVEKAALVADQNGNVHAFGLVNFACGPTGKSAAQTCRAQPVLFIVQKESDPATYSALTEWAARQTGKSLPATVLVDSLKAP